MKSIRLVWLWALVAAAVLFAAQVPMIPGIFLLFIGGPWLTGLLIHVSLIAFFVEALIGRMPRLLAVVPLLAYAGYYYDYAKEGRALAAQEAALRAATPSSPILFDPQRYSLVHARAEGFVSQYAVAAAYWKEGEWPNVYRVYFLAKAACDMERGYHSGVWVGYSQGQRFDDICDVHYAKEPPLPVFELAHHYPNPDKAYDREEITEIRIAGKVRARYTALHTTRLPKFPFIIAGCYPASGSPSWRCKFDFMRHEVTLNPYPGSRDSGRPEGALIGLKEYTDTDRVDFADYPENSALVRFAKQARNR